MNRRNPECPVGRRLKANPLATGQATRRKESSNAPEHAGKCPAPAGCIAENRDSPFGVPKIHLSIRQPKNNTTVSTYIRRPVGASITSNGKRERVRRALTTMTAPM
ncbi:hypothetical protein NDU88_001123 [Pleurodeles waltl]|uniref:Uncharacterized protein n=1 Tax=Pleurodeles waltl TaxID=8319 RepID=A0AAV7RA32_PLEWA|nr:hypothetical protein NDU88_001123 [Pleurodeles waltl]